MATKRHGRVDENATDFAKNSPEQDDPRQNAPPYPPPTTARPDEESSIKSIELEYPYAQPTQEPTSQSELSPHGILCSFRAHIVSCS